MQRTEDIVRITGDYEGASYTNPFNWNKGELTYYTNTWCWQCKTYTEHYFRDLISRGIGERCCHNCGTEYAIAINVTRFPPESTLALIDRINDQLANW
jgi:hypothetical protein